MSQSGEAMLEGRIAVAPVQYGAKSACEHCPYGGVCRVDPVLTPVRELKKLTRRPDALEAIREAESDVE